MQKVSFVQLVALACVSVCFSWVQGCAKGGGAHGDARRQFENIVEAQLPSEHAEIVGVVPGSLGPFVLPPEESVFGLLFGDNGRVFFTGEETHPGFEITGASVQTSSGQVALEQTIRRDGVDVTLPTGDRYSIDVVGDGLQIVYELAATTPATRIYFDVDANGNVSMPELGPAGEPQETWVQTVPNLNYAGYPFVDAAQAGSAVSPLQAEALGEWVQKLTRQECVDVANAVDQATALACGVNDLLVETVTQAVASAACTVANGLLGAAAGATGDAAGLRAIAGVQLGVNLGCAALQTIPQFAGTASRFGSAFGWACLTLEALQQGTALATGETLVDQVCDLLESDDAHVVRLGRDCSGTEEPRSILVTVFDDGIEDGDAFALEHNGVQLHEGPVTAFPINRDVEVVPGTHTFTIRALNEGEEPLNTGTIQIRERDTLLWEFDYALMPDETLSAQVVVSFPEECPEVVGDCDAGPEISCACCTTVPETEDGNCRFEEPAIEGDPGTYIANMVVDDRIGMSVAIAAPLISGCAPIDPSALQWLEFYTDVDEYHWEWTPDLACYDIQVCVRGNRLGIWVPSCQVNRTDGLALDERATGGVYCNLD